MQETDLKRDLFDLEGLTPTPEDLAIMELIKKGTNNQTFNVSDMCAIPGIQDYTPSELAFALHFMTQSDEYYGAYRGVKNGVVDNTKIFDELENITDEYDFIECVVVKI
jgi:hypothetical protein